MKSILFFFCLLPSVLFSQFEGEWYSSFTVMGQSMQITLTIEETPTLAARLKDPKYENFMECDEIKIKDTVLFFKWSAGGLSYTGNLNSNGVIEGKMKQSGIEWEVIFSREIREVIKLNRPQEPKGPFNYESLEYLIPNGDIVLGATLTLPSNFNDKTSIVILGSGSGPQNRNCEIMGHQPFWVIADHFAKNGIACLRFDDRGVGESTGIFGEATLEDLASDITACAQYLRKELGYTKNVLGIAGHSEGGMHALIAAKKDKKIDFVIELAAVGTNGYATLVQQQYLIPKAEGSPEDLCVWNRETFGGMGRIILKEEPTVAQDSLMAFLGKQYDNAPESFDKSNSPRAQFIMSSILFLNNDWGRQFLAFDAADYLKKLKLPILAINGTRDLQVPPTENSEGFKQFANCEVHLIDGLNHLLQHSETGRVMEYFEIEETISSEVLQLMTEWIQAQ